MRRKHAVMAAAAALAVPVAAALIYVFDAGSIEGAWGRAVVKAHSLAGRPIPVADRSWIVRQRADVSYGPHPAQRFDLYWPNEGRGPYPLIVFVHGGAFREGDKAARSLNFPIRLVRRGFALASVNYRLSGDAPFPAAVEDVVAAVRTLQRLSGGIDLDPERVAVWGLSAGGNLALLAATSGDRFAGPGRDEGRPPIRAAIAWYPPIDLGRLHDPATESPQTAALRAAHEAYLGGPPEARPDLVAAADPTSYLTPDDPPMLIQHGDADPLVPLAQSLGFVAAARAVLPPGSVEFDAVRGAWHGDPILQTEANLDRIVGFLERHLGRIER